MNRPAAPVFLAVLFGLAIALTSPVAHAAGQAQTTGQTPPGQPPVDPQTGAQTPVVVPGAEQPAGSPVLAAPPATEPPQRFSGVNGSAAQVPTPYNLAAPARQGRPNRSVFGVPPANLLPVLTLDGLVGGGRSTNPVTTQTTGAPGGGLGSAEGGYGALTGSANLTYSYSKPKIGINADNIVYGDYYPQYEDKKFQPRTIATFAVNFVPAKRTRVTVSQGYKNLPEFSFSELQDTDFGPAVPINQDANITVERYWRYGSSVDVSQKLTSRSSANVSMAYAHGQLTTGSGWNTLSFNGSYDHAIGKGLSAYFGYIYGQQVFHGSDGRTSKDTHPTLRFGVDFARALSIARRTTLAFSTGLSEIEDRAENQKLYHLIGAASLKREFGRSWDASLVYSRNARFIEAVNETLLSDSLSLIAQGLFARRAQVKAAFGASSGQFGARATNGFDSYFGSVQLSLGLSRNLAFGTDYSYSHLTNPNGAIPIAASGLYSQSSLRAYIKLWTALLTKKRAY